MKTSAFSLLVLLMMFSFSNAHARLLVAVTVPAQEWLVKQIAGDHVDILTMVPAGHVPESAQPGPRNMARFQQADIHFTIGHPDFIFEERYIKPYRENTDAATWLSMYEVVERLMPTHMLPGSDPHLWTSPSIMMASADVIERTLNSLEPENSELFTANLQALHEKINKITEKIRAQLKVRDSDKLLVYHPAWGHFCQDFELQQLAIEKEGKVPGAGSLSGFFIRVAENNINFIVSSPGADERIAGMIADQYNINMILVNPMDSDWFKMMSMMQQAVENDSNHDK